MCRNDTVYIEILQKIPKICNFLQKQTKKKKKTALKCLFAKSTSQKGHKMKSKNQIKTKLLVTLAFALIGSTALAQNTIDDIEREIQMLEKQKNS